MITDNKPIKKTVKSRKQAPALNRSKWWNEPQDTLFQAVFGVVNRIQESQVGRRINNFNYAKLYQDLNLLSYYGGFYSNNRTVNSSQNRAQARCTYNIIKSCIDTVSAKVSKDKPKVQFLTEEGDYSLQTKAKKLTQYVSGLFDQTKSYEIGQQCFVDACVFGTGVAHVFETDDGNIGVERVFIEELFVDEFEGMYGEPRQIHRQKLVSRDVLKEQFPEQAQKIATASRKVVQSGNSFSSEDADQILLIESWHLPSGSDAKDGRHTLSIDNACIFEEEYTKNYFPLVFIRWNKKQLGFWGWGLCEELVGIQLEINKLLRSIQIAQDRMAIPRVFIENGSAVSDDHMTVNAIGAVIRYTGTPPTFSSGTTIAPEIYQHLESLYKKAYELSGVSQLSAMSTKPAGLNSGVSLREYQDIETERFIIIGQQYQNFFVDLAKIMIDMAKDLYSDNNKLTVKVVGNKFVETISWKDVDMNSDEYSLRGFPISILPSTPAGKLQAVQELIQAGWISQDYGLSLLDFPDLDEYVSVQTASLEYTRLLIDRMLNEGKYTPPDPYMNLQLAAQLTQAEYNRAKLKKNIPEANLELLRTFIKDVQSIQGIGQQAAPPEATPQGRPQLAPQSDLIPQKAPGQQ